jgi:hypothetical protein
VGIDDIDLSRHVRPALTTIALPKRNLAETAVELLVDKLTTPREKPSVSILQPFLVRRQSTCNVNLGFPRRGRFAKSTPPRHGERLFTPTNGSVKSTAVSAGVTCRATRPVDRARALSGRFPKYRPTPAESPCLGDGDLLFGPSGGLVSSPSLSFAASSAAIPATGRRLQS